MTSDGFNEVQHEKQQELMIDSYISQSRQVDVGRVLEPWVPDEDDPRCPELENIFDGHWNRLLLYLYISTDFEINVLAVKI